MTPQAGRLGPGGFSSSFCEKHVRLLKSSLLWAKLVGDFSCGDFMAKLASIRVLGLHRVELAAEEIDAMREYLWGDGPDAEASARQHFKNLCLVEIEVSPPGGEIDWIQITQPIPGKPQSSWQVPWDERKIGVGRWAFFLHMVRMGEPLRTQLGPVDLPAPTPTPEHLAGIEYELPG